MKTLVIDTIFYMIFTFITMLLTILFFAIIARGDTQEQITTALKNEQRLHGTPHLPWGNRVLYADWGTRGTTGVVGYSPVVIVLPQGMNFGTSVSISADRRYIRYSGTPMFSSIPQWSTYNIENGTTTIHK